MSRRRRFLYIFATILIAWVISYAGFTACNLPELPEMPEETTTGGDSP